MDAESIAAYTGLWPRMNQISKKLEKFTNNRISSEFFKKDDNLQVISLNSNNSILNIDVSNKIRV